MEAALRKDLWTLKNDKANEVVSSVYGSVSEDIISNTDVSARVIQALGLKKISPEEKEADDVEYSMEDKSLPDSF